MSKTIKLDDNVHQNLEALRYKRETFSQVVARLIDFYQGSQRLVSSHTGEHPRIPGQGV